jgi:FAD/FMN-containing dehydrogenase
MGGGAVNEGVIADFTRYFNRIVEIKKLSAPATSSANRNLASSPQGEEGAAGYAIVEPGVFYRDFEPKTLEQGLILPCYTASKSLNTLGGMAANNSAGEKTLTYGQTKDYVEEMNVVLADGNEYTFAPLDEHGLEQKMRLTTLEGEIYRKIYQLIKSNRDLIQKSKPKTSKNSAGYYLWNVWDGRKFDMNQVLVGSQGTLGIITKIKYRLVHFHPKSELLVIFLKDLNILGKLVHRVMDFKPETFESFDDHTFKLAMKYLPDMIKKMSAKSSRSEHLGGSATMAPSGPLGGKVNLFKLAWQFLPELGMVITGGVPKLILIAEFTGETELNVGANMRKAQIAVEQEFGLKTHITKSAQEAEKYWTVRRESFNLLRQHSKGVATAPFIDDIIVRPENLPQFLPELNSILEKYPSLIYTIAGHMGDGNFHIIPLMDLSKADQRMIIPRLADEVYALVLKYEGSITAEHNDGLIRTPYLEKMFGREMVKLFAQVKQIFDPQNIFNPRKKVGATIEYVMGHMKKTL